MEGIVGQKIEVKIIKEILISLGFEVFSDNKEENILKIIIPSWRATRDVSIAEDIVEEIIRIYGFNDIKIESPLIKLEVPIENNQRKVERLIKNILSKSSFLNEIYNYSFVGEELMKKLNINYSSHIKLVNPLSNNHTLLRQSLIPNLLENIKNNQSKYDQIGLFEIGSVFYDSPSNINKDDKSKDSLPFQEIRLAVLIAENNKKKIISLAKGVLENLMENFDLDLLYDKKDDLIGWEEINSLTKIIVNNQEIGYLCLVDNKALNRLGVKIKIGALELNLELLTKIISGQNNKKYNGIPKYPSAVRDLAFVVRDKILYNDIKNEIENFDVLITSVELFDVYQGVKLGKNKKSLAFHVNYQANDRTLTNEEVDQIQNKLVRNLEKKYEAVIRNF
jgi:phenylalanyl-tRNA synthetase beta chain